MRRVKYYTKHKQWDYDNPSKSVDDIQVSKTEWK